MKSSIRLTAFAVMSLTLPPLAARAVPPTPAPPAAKEAKPRQGRPNRPRPQIAATRPADEVVTKVDFTEAAKDADGLKPASGLKVEAFATHPLIANPVSFTVDARGRFWVVECFRFDDNGPHGGVYDIRHIYDKLDDDLAAKTVDDRRAMVTRWLGGDLSRLTKDSDRLRLVEDTDGDNRADRATVFADGFNDAMDGLAAGVLVRGDDVYFANMPHLWRLRDADGDGRADEREPLSSGYGVRYAFLGHDLHGLTWGPDGRLYFSFGDRGAHVQTKEGETLAVPDTGAVFRCDPDGSNLEIFATGLRNPQELAFDEHGNLFTGDNNCDKGDPARWVYVVEGGDSGWRIGYQHLATPHNGGPWMSEKLHALEKDATAHYLLPPLAHIGHGPSGLAYYPGTGLPEKFADRFFLCDFRAGPSSVVHSFALKPKGASFEVVKDKSNLLERSAVTDVAFGNDGSVYVSDWMGAGYKKQNQGRIYRLFDPEAAKDPVVQQTKALLTEGMAQRDAAELAKLLGHADQRVRREAQFELAGRGAGSLASFTAALGQRDNTLARVHAIWGLGQIARATKDVKPLDALLPLLTDEDEEVRAQAAKAVGEGRVAAAHEPLVKLLADASARVRFMAAMSLGKLGRPEAIGAVLTMLADAKDADAYLRHAGVMALTGIGERDASAVVAAGNHPSASARMGVLLALRQLGRPEVATFLNAAEPQLVLEAARAINDEPIEAAFPQLAQLLSRPDAAAKLPEPVLHRALNAHFRLGAAGNAAAVAALAATPSAPDVMRVEALAMLKEWDAPRGADRIVGVWRPLPKRDASIAQAAARGVLPSILLPARHAPDGVRVAALELLKKTGADQPDLLFQVVTHADTAPAVGAAALSAMNALNDARTDEAVELALANGRGALREQAIKFLARRPDAAQRLEALLANGSVPDQQAVFAALGTLEGNAAAEQALSASMDRLLAGGVRPELVLDLLEAAERSKAPGVQQKLAQFNDARPKADEALADFAETLVGGDAEAGRKIFIEKAEVSCVRCHKVNGEGGLNGPDLSDVGLRKDRTYLLRSLLDPNADIAPGFENVTIRMKSAKTYAGVVRSDTENELVLDSGDGVILHADKKEIASRTKGLSPMPQDISKPLTKRELRNLVEFLATQKQPTTAPSTPTEPARPQTAQTPAPVAPAAQ